MGRKTKLLIAVGFVLGAVGVVLAATLTAPVSDGVTLGAPDGMNATLDGSADLYLEDFTDGSDTVNITTANNGEIKFTSAGPAWATVGVSNITGTYTNITNIDATNTDITINPFDKAQITVGKQIDHVAFRSTTDVDDATVDFTYGGSSGESKVTLNTVPVSTQIAAVDASTNDILDIATSDGSGSITFDNLDNSDHAVLLQTNQGGPTLSNLQDDGSLR